MRPLPAILIYDRDALFREALRNFLLAEGYPQVEVVKTAQEALAKLCHERYGYILIGVSRPLSCERRLAAIVQRRQPATKVFLLVSAEDQPLIKDPLFECVIKERVFSNMLELM